MNKLRELAGSFKIDTERYNVIGLDVHGVDDPSIAFIAIDKEKSTEEKEHIVKIAAGDLENLGQVLERLHLVLIDRFRQGYLERDVDEEIDIN